MLGALNKSSVITVHFQIKNVSKQINFCIKSLVITDRRKMCKYDNASACKHTKARDVVMVTLHSM